MAWMVVRATRWHVALRHSRLWYECYPPLASCQANYFFSSCCSLCTEVVGTCFVVSILLMEMVPESCSCTNSMKKTKILVEIEQFNYLQKCTPRWVRNTWVIPPLRRGILESVKNTCFRTLTTLVVVIYSEVFSRVHTVLIMGWLRTVFLPMFAKCMSKGVS